MEQVTLVVGFGSAKKAAAWAISMSLDQGAISLGMRVQFAVNLFLEGKPVIAFIIGQVCAIGELEDGSPVFYCYGGEEFLNPAIAEKLEDNSWSELDGEKSRQAIKIMEAAAPAAATRTIFLLVGDPDILDEEGLPVFEIWQKTLNPDNPVLPAFGQRLQLQVIPDEETVTEDPAVLSDPDFFGNIELPVSRSEADRTLSVMVFYSGLFQAGIGAVGMWAPTMGTIDGFDMLEAGWKMPDTKVLNLKGFRIGERIDLARRTHLLLSSPESDGLSVVEDYFLHDAETVPENQYDLLPTSLVEHVKASKELANSDDIFDQWRKELGEPEL